MALYTQDSIERVREAVDMVELVSAKTDLRRVGGRWVGLCPFHEERTPSFSVNAEKRLYYCFGCGEKGDAIGFVRETEALDFREAVEHLAERYNVELKLEHEDPEAERRRRRRERLLAVLDRTARFYSAYLWESAEAARAREYLQGRGLNEDVLREFRVGYAPSAWDTLLLRAQREGFSVEELIATGLAQRGKDGGNPYDRFRGRIMFPLADFRGNVLGFGARSMGEGRGPKYLNTAEGELYRKGRQLFGIDLARAHAAKAERVLAVEGYTDVLSLHQAGLGETVAIMGTALTTEQLTELARTAPLVLLALDADRSGQEAMLRAARMAEERGVELRVVEMPPGSDPADLLAAGGLDDFSQRVDRSLSVVEFQLNRVLADADLETPQGRDRALEEARPLINDAPVRSAMRDHLVRLAADRLDLPADYVTAQLRAGGGETAAAPGRGPAPASAGLAPERAILIFCLGAGELGREYLGRLRGEHFSSETGRRAQAHLMDHPDDPLAALPEDDPELARLLTEVAVEADELDSVSEQQLHASFLQLELRRIDRELRSAAHEGDLARQNELAGAKQEVRQEIDTVMGQTA
jgi:DNA primase